MKTWQRILVVIVLLGIGVTVGFIKLFQGQRVNASSVMNLHQISLGLLMYTDDYNNRFPDLSDPLSLKKAVAIYLNKDASQTERFFVHPKTGKPYEPNSPLSYQERKGPNASAGIAVIYEDEPSGDGTRGVLFGDCHVERVTESRWQDLKKSSHIS